MRAATPHTTHDVLTTKGHKTRAGLAVCVLAMGSLATCKSLDHIDFDSTGRGTIPAATVVDKVMGATTFNGFQNIDFSQQYRNQGVTRDEVDSVHLTSITVEILTPQ